MLRAGPVSPVQEGDCIKKYLENHVKGKGKSVLQIGFCTRRATEQTSIFYFERQIKGNMVGIQKIVMD